MPFVLVGVLLATASVSAAATARLVHMQVQPGPVVAVRLDFSTPVSPVVRSLPASESTPERIYIDLPATKLGEEAPRIMSGAGALLRVRTGQYDANTARIVLDLAVSQPYVVRHAAQSITIELTDPAPVVAPAPTPEVAKAAPPPTAPEPAPVVGKVTPPPAAPAPEMTMQAPPSATPAPEVAKPTPPPTTSAPEIAKLAPPPVTLAPAPTVVEPAPKTAPAAKDTEALPAPAAPGVAEPAPPSALPAPPARTAERALIVVDAGHGGRDPGATGLDGVAEKTITLALARQLAERLPARLPVDVFLTRTEDAFVPIDARVAAAADATLFISLHANASPDPRMNGIEVFFGGSPAHVSACGPPMRLGHAVSHALGARLADARTLVRLGGYGVLTRNAVPSVLLEIGYLTNARDAAQIRDASYQTLFTAAVVDAVAAYLEPSQDFVLARDRTRT
jgi:N-acetylmuramoyl-L-alanine amidase